MRPIREAIQKKRAAGPSMGLRLLLYWFTMVLLLMAAILSTLMATGVLSHPAHQLSGTLDIQQRNTYAALDSQMDALTAQSMAMSEKLGKELDAFLAAKGIAFDELNNDPDTIAELEKRLYTPLSNTLGAASCSGIFFGLNVTANTSLPNAEDFRAGLYLRYSGLQPTVASEQDVICFRGAAETARSLQLQMHNRWNPELNVQAIPGYTQLLHTSNGRLAERCLWTGRIALPDTWESVTLLCVPLLASAGNVRGICGAELSDLYFRLTYPAVDSAYGSMVTVLAPIDGDRLLLTRYRGRPFKKYALIAGFNEIGETIEQTVHREVLEEAGVRVKNLRFYTSQPWVFTDTLLMGFVCELDGSDRISVQESELAEANWHLRSELPQDHSYISLTGEMIEQFRLGKL